MKGYYGCWLLANYTVRVGCGRCMRLASLLASKLVFMHDTSTTRANCCFLCNENAPRMEWINLIVPVMSVDTNSFGGFFLFPNAYSSVSFSMLIWQTYPFFVFNWLFLFGSMKPASKRERCQAIEWMPRSNRPQSIPTYCCQRVASIWVDSHRWNTDPWTMPGCAHNRWWFRRFAMGDSNLGASLVRDSNRSNRPVRWCRNTTICVEHCPRQPSRPPMSDLLISPVNRVEHPPNRLCTSKRRYPPPIQWWI